MTNVSSMSAAANAPADLVRTKRSRTVLDQLNVSVTGRTLWAIELRRGSPVARIAIEQTEGSLDLQVVVDGVLVGRSDCLEAVLAYAHHLEDDPERAAQVRDRVGRWLWGR